VVRHTHLGPTWLGERDGSRSPRIAAIAGAVEKAGLKPIVVDDIVAVIWDKWILNASINAICAITGLRQGEIPRTSALEAFQDRIMDELFAVTAAKGVTHSDANLRETIKAQCWRKFNKPSMLQHLEAGKQTEIDVLNGAAVRFGREVGVATPYNDALTMLIKGAEKRAIMRREGEPDYALIEAEVAKQKRPTTVDQDT